MRLPHPRGYHSQLALCPALTLLPQTPTSAKDMHDSGTGIWGPSTQALMLFQVPLLGGESWASHAKPSMSLQAKGDGVAIIGTSCPLRVGKKSG